MLVNLLSNSFKFTEKGGTIEVCMSELDVDDSRTVLHITVRDTGCGISDKALEKIWEPFEQEQHENGKYYGGSGLGLPITKSIVEHIMWVQNSSWTFHLRLEKVLCGRNVSSDH